MQPAHSSVISAPVTSQKEQQTEAGGAHVDGAVVDVVIALVAVDPFNVSSEIALIKL